MNAHQRRKKFRRWERVGVKFKHPSIYGLIELSSGRPPEPPAFIVRTQH